MKLLQIDFSQNFCKLYFQNFEQKFIIFKDNKEYFSKNFEKQRTRFTRNEFLVLSVTLMQNFISFGQIILL